MTKKEILKHISDLLNTLVGPSQISINKRGFIDLVCDKNHIDDVLSNLSKSNILIIDGFYSYFAYYKIRLYNLDDVYNISI